MVLTGFLSADEKKELSEFSGAILDNPKLALRAERNTIYSSISENLRASKLEVIYLVKRFYKKEERFPEAVEIEQQSLKMINNSSPAVAAAGKSLYWFSSLKRLSTK